MSEFKVPEPAEPTPKITGLYEQLAIDPAEIEKLREQLVQGALLRLRYIYIIRLKGGAIHKVNHKATAKRRAANKVARKQRRVNRDGAR